MRGGACRRCGPCVAAAHGHLLPEEAELPRIQEFLLPAFLLLFLSSD